MWEKRSGSRKRDDLDRARPADPREVVAAEVDEHHVLGTVLLGGEQPLGVALARTGRAGDRVDRCPRAVALDERLRRGADERELAQLEQEEVGRRVHAPQRPVERERRDGRRPLGTLREHDLERIAAPDELLARDRRPARSPAGTGSAAVSARAPDSRGGGASSPRAARRVSAPPRSTSATPSAWSKRTSVSGDDEPALRQPAAAVRQRHGRLEPRDEVVAEVPDDRLAAALGLLEGEQPRAAADERVAPEPALLDRLEQEARAPLVAAGGGTPRAG